MSLAPENLKTLVTVPTEVEATVIVNELESEGIRARSVGGFIADFREGIPAGFSVIVAESDLPQAKEVLEQLRRHRGDVDWSQVDVDKPDASA